ncbi:MAG: HNH endonuclease [Pirellulaceae bacterium]
MPTAAASLFPRIKQKETRPDFRRRGYTHQWDKARVVFLGHNPLCVHCKAEDKLTPATCVDHIVPHRGDMVKFWDVTNWQPLCRSCHSRKTARGG